MIYEIFGIGLQSDSAIPELPVPVKHEPEISFVYGGTRDLKDVRWLHHWETSEGEVCISSGVVSDGYVLRFPGLADFWVAKELDRIESHPLHRVPQETIRHLLLDQVIPRALGQRGELILHAAAVVLESGKLVAFSGASGVGKSTLASSFQQSGAVLVSDDCLHFSFAGNQIEVVPNYYGVRLYEDSSSAIFGDIERTPVAHYTDKQRISIKSPESRQISRPSIDALYLLESPRGEHDGETINIRKVSGTKELTSIIEQVFVLDVTDRRVMAIQFRNVGKLLESGLMISELSYPRDLGVLPVVRAAVEKSL